MQKRSSSSARIFYQKYSREEIIEKIKEVVTTLKDEICIQTAILFGSYAKGNYTVASDVDIFIVYDEERSDIDLVNETLMKNLQIPRAELHILSRKEYDMMKKSKWIKSIHEEVVKIIDSAENHDQNQSSKT